MILIVVSTGHFDPLIEAAASLGSAYQFVAQIGSGTFIPPFEHFRTLPPAELLSKMRSAELVVTHAGTGMLSMLYQIKKPAVVVPKQIRYGEANDGQVELAQKWAALGMAELCLDVTSLGDAIGACRKRIFLFPEFDSLGQHLRREFEVR